MTVTPDLTTNLSRISLAAAQHVAPYLRSVARTSPETYTKRDIHDPVTVHDRHVEKQLRSILGAAVPGSRVLGEEYGEETLPSPTVEETAALKTILGDEESLAALQNVAELGKRTRWIVDPIDGTANFASGMTYFGTSIAAELDGKVVAGVVTIPCMFEAFVADAHRFWHVDRDGRETPLTADGPSEENQALIASYYPGISAYEENMEKAARRERTLLSTYSTLRRPGAAALDLAQVAAGWIGVSMGVSFGPWDVAAGLHMVRVAGGNVLNLQMGTDLPDGLRPAQVSSGRNLDAVTAKGILYEVEKEVLGNL